MIVASTEALFYIRTRDTSLYRVTEEDIRSCTFPQRVRAKRGEMRAESEVVSLWRLKEVLSFKGVLSGTLPFSFLSVKDSWQHSGSAASKRDACHFHKVSFTFSRRRNVRSHLVAYGARILFHDFREIVQLRNIIENKW